jgi:hypothetical protein
MLASPRESTECWVSNHEPQTLFKIPIFMKDGDEIAQVDQGQQLCPHHRCPYMCAEVGILNKRRILLLVGSVD